MKYVIKIDPVSVRYFEKLQNPKYPQEVVDIAGKVIGTNRWFVESVVLSEDEYNIIKPHLDEYE